MPQSTETGDFLRNCIGCSEEPRKTQKKLRVEKKPEVRLNTNEDNRAVSSHPNKGEL